MNLDLQNQIKAVVYLYNGADVNTIMLKVIENTVSSIDAHSILREIDNLIDSGQLIRLIHSYDYKHLKTHLFLKGTRFLNLMELTDVTSQITTSSGLANKSNRNG